jgi:hypothetical protein
MFRLTATGPSSTGQVGLVLGDQCLSGKGPKGLRQGVGDSNSGPPERWPGRSSADGLTGDSSLPVVTAGDRCIPSLTGSAYRACSKGFWPIWSRTLLCGDLAGRGSPVRLTATPIDR